MATTSVAAVKGALVTVLRSLYANDSEVSVYYGQPGTYLTRDIVCVTDIDVQIDRPTMGTNRSREETSTLTVIVSCFREGDDTMQQTVTERAVSLADVVQQRFRTFPNETLGGTCREAWVSEMQVMEANDEGVLAIGRNTTVTLTVTARARI